MKRSDIQELATVIYKAQPEIGLVKCAVLATEIYQWQKNRTKASEGQRNVLREALSYLLEQTVDQDLKYGVPLSEGEEDARAKALSAMAVTD